ncbi:uncharacterized protein LOC120281621 isoform X2 [Dioscorea cayenensis subsp. rotundata]|uniref:Uncharacterized protein LOC120281621 isoform X2 n=1 Tax=Dioscorea cayennensis subsp. rotundata TaxID=55577 RepID=A0AB40D1Y8_DIOCR|nr:uncharacterized protein LOC120281621 isoform X2 [Dioscorea cayenensis subsp. rotundata]
MSSSAANSPSPAATSASASSPRRASPTPVSSSPTSPLATDDEYEIPERSSKIIKRASSRSSSTIRDEGFGDDHAPSSSSEELHTLLPMMKLMILRIKNRRGKLTMRTCPKHIITVILEDLMKESSD